MGRKRTRSRIEERAPYEEDEETLDDDDLEDDDDDDDDDLEDDDDDDDEEVVVEKKKPKRKAPTRRRTRASKTPRMKVVWGVFDNSNKRVATFEYGKRDEADAHAEKLEAEKSKGPYFVQPVKEPIEETPAEDK